MRALIACLSAFLLFETRAADVPSAAPESELFRQFPRMHDPSTIIRCKGDYWVFSTGNGIRSARSKDLVAWTAGPIVFPKTPAWVGKEVPGQKGHFWAPDIIELNGRFLLYYSISAFGKNTSAIALASSATLDPADPAYGWKDEGIVISSGPKDDFNAIDPALTRDRAGGLWMTFGSFWSGIKLIELDPGTGKRKQPASPPIALAHAAQIEAAAIIPHGDEYFLFVNWGYCCRGVNSTYRIQVGRSQSITGPYLDRQGRDLREGGGSDFLQTEATMIGPGHAAVFREGEKQWLSYHFYDGNRRGAPTLAVRQLEWDGQGWPRPDRLISPPQP